MAAMNTVEIDIARKQYPGRGDGSGLVALQDMRLSVGEGELVCVVGPSGCGKTTLLNIVSGLDGGFDGKVTVAGSAPGDGPPVGYMFQSPRLMPWLSVRDNVRLVQDGDGAGDGLADELLGRMGLGDFLDAYPGALSGGMQRRAALARAFVTEPRLLLLDEPFLSLDAPVANRLRMLLLDMWRSRPTTVIFITHDLREALFLADRIVFMSPSPGANVLDLPVEMDRPREAEGEEVEMVRLGLLKKYPQILAGLTAVEDGGVLE